MQKTWCVSEEYRNTLPQTNKTIISADLYLLLSVPLSTLKFLLYPMRAQVLTGVDSTGFNAVWSFKDDTAGHWLRGQMKVSQGHRVGIMQHFCHFLVLCTVESSGFARLPASAGPSRSRGKCEAREGQLKSSFISQLKRCILPLWASWP